jgi:prepilin-type N-terminal cleavage/methylation domain-containing protein
MPTPAPIQSKRGYTLIEILIVILIISIVGVASLLSISSNKNTRLQNFSKELTNLISLAEQQAMLQPAVLGLVFTKDSLQFYRYKEATDATKKSSWEPLDNESVLGKHALPKNISIALIIADKVIPPSPTPRLIITASGGLTPFVILIGEKNSPPRFQVIGSDDGSVTSQIYSNEKK